MYIYIHQIIYIIYILWIFSFHITKDPSTKNVAFSLHRSPPKAFAAANRQGFGQRLQPFIPQTIPCQAEAWIDVYMMYIWCVYMNDVYKDVDMCILYICIYYVYIYIFTRTIRHMPNSCVYIINRSSFIFQSLIYSPCYSPSYHAFKGIHTFTHTHTLVTFHDTSMNHKQQIMNVPHVQRWFDALFVSELILIWDPKRIRDHMASFAETLHLTLLASNMNVN